MISLKTAFLHILPLLKKEVEINPYTLEWGLHYIFGKGEPKRLPKKLIRITRRDIIKTLFEKAGFSSSTLWGHAEFHYYKGNLDWFTHPTMGVVGGFIYKLVSWEDEFVCKCQDDWDFNTNLGSYNIPLPPLTRETVAVIKKLLPRLGLNLSLTEVEEEDEDGNVYQEEFIGINEASLARFNESHSFRTTWEVTLPNGLSCPIDHRLGEKWREEERQYKKRWSDRRRRLSEFREP